MPILLVLACAPSIPQDSESEIPWVDPPVEVAEGWSDPADYLFNRLMVHRVEITLSDQDLSALSEDPYTYVEGDARFDGTELPSVGVRLKGRIGSFRELNKKSGFKLDLNRYEPGRRFYGQEQLTLNNSVVDCSYAKEHLGYAIYRAAGVPAPRNGYAWVTVNGATYGLYVLTETPDDRFLDRVFDDGEGTLYDGKYLYDPETRNYQLLDFYASLAPLYEQEEGPDIGNADSIAFTEVLATNEGRVGFYEAMGAVLNWERHHKQVAVAQFIGHVDGYSINTNNYRMYFDPSDGDRATMLPWDLDYAFLDASDWGRSWASPRGRLTQACWRDEDCIEGQRAAMEVLLDEVYDKRGLLDLMEEIEELTEPWIDEDPRRECTDGADTTTRAQLRSWVRNRPDTMEDFWEL